MTAIIAFFGRILAVLPLSITSILGILQVIIKLFKEIVTLVINLLFPFTPDGGKFEEFVLKVRDAINKFSDMFEVAKTWLTKIAGLTI